MHAYTLMLVTALGFTVAAAPGFAQVPAPAPSGPATSTSIAPRPFTAAPGQFIAATSTYAPRYGGTGDRFSATADAYAPRYGRPTDLPPRPFGFGYTDSFLPSGLMFIIPGPTNGTHMREADHDRTGALSLRVQPAHAQVFVDGAYAGTAADFAGPGLAIDAGAHRVEVRADGYETHAFDRRILAGDTSTYRYDMWAVRAPMSTNARLVDTVAVRTPFYIIAGCYAGNRPPTANQLPAGCDVSNVRTVEYMVRVPAR